MKCKIIWFTGLSGSGKTTLANHIYKQIRLKKFKETRKIRSNFN